MTPITFSRPDGSTFTLTPAMPRTYAALFDLGAAAAATDGPLMLRCRTAALGLGLAGQALTTATGLRVPMPPYRNDGDIAAYGGTVMEILAGQWRVVPNEDLWKQAWTLVGELLDNLPTQEGVTESTNFTSPSEAP